MIPLAEALTVLAGEGIAIHRSDCSKAIRSGAIVGRLEATRPGSQQKVWIVDLESVRDWHRRRSESQSRREVILEADDDSPPIRIARLWGIHPTRGRIHAVAILRERGRAAARRMASELAAELYGQGAIRIARCPTVVPLALSASGLD
jgi:hypothetical protein